MNTSRPLVAMRTKQCTAASAESYPKCRLYRTRFVLTAHRPPSVAIGREFFKRQPASLPLIDHSPVTNATTDVRNAEISRNTCVFTPVSVRTLVTNATIEVRNSALSSVTG